MRLFTRQVPELLDSRATRIPDNLVYTPTGHPLYLEFKEIGGLLHMVYIGTDVNVTVTDQVHFG